MKMWLDLQCWKISFILFDENAEPDQVNMRATADQTRNVQFLITIVQNSTLCVNGC